MNMYDNIYGIQETFLLFVVEGFSEIIKYANRVGDN